MQGRALARPLDRYEKYSQGKFKGKRSDIHPYMNRLLIELRVEGVA